MTNGPRTAIGWRTALTVLYRAVLNFNEDRASLLAAAISYYALFSLFPLAILAVAVFGIVLRDPEVERDVFATLVNAIPVEAPAVNESLQGLARLGPTLTIVALLATAWSATALSSAVRRSISIAFDIDRPRPLLRGKAIDYLVLPILGLAFLASFVLTTAWRVIGANARDDFGFFAGDWSWLWGIGALAIPAVLTFLVFTVLYWLLPNHRVQVRPLLPGAALAAIGFELVKHGFAIYVANFSNYDVVYGSLGSLMALLFWLFLSANVFLFGAEVAAETPHVLNAEPRHGHSETMRGPARDPGWRAAVWAFVRGLAIAPAEDIRRSRRDSERPTAGNE